MKTVRNARSVSIRAPAKINLGLEILGRRRDGYHEIRSILAMIDVCDDLQFAFGGTRGLSSFDGVAVLDNSIDMAVRLFQARVANAKPVTYTLKKRIPVAAGLGGASSDAAATLVAMNRLHADPLTDEELREIATELGSDVPFFLGSPVAYVAGTGTDTERIPELAGAVLLIVPNVVIPRKTATMYGHITTKNYSAGLSIERTRERLCASLPPDPADLANAFMKPLYELVPHLAALPKILRDVGCAGYGISGAGPTHYALLDPLEISEVVSRLQRELDCQQFTILTTKFLADATGLRCD